MPNISKINAVDIGNIAKVDGATSSNIAKVDGLDFVTFTGLLDTYTGAEVAYSVRQLKSGVTVAMRVRRDTAGGTGDDDEADIAFDTSLTDPTISLDSAISNASAGVTATTLGEFLNVGTVNSTTYSNPDSLSGTASCFADEWKDQSGNANHASQATFGNQPQIHSGTVDTDLITSGSLPALYSVTGNVLLATQGTITDASVLAVYQLSSTAADTYLINNDISGSRYRLRFFNGRYYLYLDGITWAGNTYSLGSRHLHSFYDNGSTVYWRTNGGGELSRAFTGSISYRNFTGEIANTTFHQEYIVFDSNQYDNRTGIETDINSFFGIY